MNSWQVRFPRARKDCGSMLLVKQHDYNVDRQQLLTVAIQVNKILRLSAPPMINSLLTMGR